MAWYATGVATVSALGGAFGQISGNEAAREAAQEQADMTYAQRMEEVRRAKIEQARTLGGNVAAVGASNVQFSGSAQDSIDSMRASFARDISWRNLSAEKEKQAIQSGGPGSSADFAAAAGAAGSIANTVITARG
jgi:hypothetical protein